MAPDINHWFWQRPFGFLNFRVPARKLPGFHSWLPLNWPRISAIGFDYVPLALRTFESRLVKSRVSLAVIHLAHGLYLWSDLFPLVFFRVPARTSRVSSWLPLNWPRNWYLFTPSSSLDWLVLWYLASWIIYHMVLQLVVFLLNVVLCYHNSGFFAEEAEKSKGCCPVQVVAFSSGWHRSSTTRFGTQLDTTYTGRTSQQGPQTSTSDSPQAQRSNGFFRTTAVEMRSVQAAGEGKTAILPQLWILVGRSLRWLLQKSTTVPADTQRSWLDLEFLARPQSRQGTDTEKTESICQTTRQRLGKGQGKRQRERERQRKGQGEGQGQQRTGCITFPSQQFACAHDYCHTLPSHAEHGHARHELGGDSCQFIAGHRSHHGYQESVPRCFYDTFRNPRRSRQVGSCCDEGLAPSHIGSRQGTEVGERTGRSQRPAQNSVVGSHEGVTGELAAANASLRRATVQFHDCHHQSSQRDGPGPPVHPSLERQSCGENTPRTPTGQERGSGSASKGRRSGGKRSPKTSPSNGSPLRTTGERKDACTREDTSKCRSLPCERRGEGWTKNTKRKKTTLYLAIHLACAYGHYWHDTCGTCTSTTGCYWNVTTGSALLRLRSTGRLPNWRRNVRFDVVEAYHIFDYDDDAACQAQPYHCLFNQTTTRQIGEYSVNPFEAALAATELHGNVIDDSIAHDLSLESKAYLLDCTSSGLSRVDVDSHHDTLVQPQYSNDRNDTKQYLFFDAIDGTPRRGTENESPHSQPTYKDSVRGTGIPHVYDLWCDDLTHGAESFCDYPSGDHAIIEGHWQEPAEAIPDGDLDTTEVVPTDPIVMSTIEPAQRPLPFVFASASDDAMLDEIILGHPQAHKHLTVRTFGYKRRHLGQRSLQLKESELPHWRHRVQELWIDHDEQPPRIFPIRPPPYLEPHTISVIVQLGDGTADEIVALTQTIHDEAHGLEPTEPIVHSIPHIVTKTGLCLKLNIHPALHSSAVVKQGHAIWLTGFPKTLSNGVYLRVLIDTPTDEAVSLLQENTPTILCQPQIIQTRLLDDARARNTRPRISSPDDIPVEAPRLLPPHTGGTNRLFPWHLWEELFNNMEGDNFRFVFYGLAVEPIQTRWGSTQDLSRQAVFQLARRLFPEMTEWDLRLHYVTPQPSDPFAQVHVLAEFLLGDALPGPMVPVLRDVRWFAPRNLHRELRAAAYLNTPTNKRLLVEDLAEQCMPDGDMLCSVWTRGEPCLEQTIATLHRGDMVNIRLLPAWQDDIGHGVSFDNGQFFYAYGVTITHQGFLQPLTAYVHSATEATITRSFAGFDVNTLREIGFLANAIWGQDTTVTFCAASSDLTHGMHFLASQTGSEATPILIEQRHLAAGGTYRRRFRMALILPQMTIAQCVALNTAPHWHGMDSEREILLNSDPITDARIHSTEPVANGALITIIVGDPGERILSADETIHPSDEDTDISDLLQQTLAVRQQDSQEPTVKQCRPNHELIIDRDDIIPYERRFHNGDHFLGRIIPPPNWQSQPVVRQAANVGAARRDGDGQPYVLFRTWLLLHEGQSPRVSRNLEIRAQLVVQLSERVRTLWSDLVGIFDATRVTIVTPTPAREGDDDTRIHVLVERNRPFDSTLRPILLSFQQITREGLSTAIEWFPLLTPPVITLPYLQQTCQLPCELHHLLVPRAPSHRGWLEPHQQRHVTPGNYIPGWWDIRRQPPGSEDGGDDNSHLQVSTVRACGTLSYPHVSDLWCDNTVFHTPAQHVDMTYHEIPHDISVGQDALVLMQRGAIKKRRTTESSQSTTPIVQAFHVYRLSTTYELVPAPPPEQGADVPGHILGLMSTHLGFEATEPARCHPISATIQGMMTLPAFIYEHSGDSFSQQYTDDILALVDITIRGQDNTEHKIRRVLWLRTASTRSALLNTLRCGDICEVMNPPCRVFLNNGFWSELDSVRRHFDFGDYIEIFIEADKPVEETLSCLRIAEISDRKRRIFLDTPPPDSPSQEDDQAGDNWVSTSEEQSSEPQDGMIKKVPGAHTSRVLTLNDKIDLPPQHVAMTAIRIFAPVGTGLPEYLEIEETHDTIKVQRELVNWGHHHAHCTLLNWDDTPLGYAVTLKESSTQFLLLFLNPDTGEHFWSEQQEDDEISLLRTLGRFGQRRCVILDRHNSGQLQVVYFIDTTVKDPEQSEVQWHIVRIPQVSYPRPKQNKISQRIRLTDVDNTDCLLRAPASNIDDIMNLFRANDFLQTSVAELTLPPKCLIATKNTTQRTNFDRLRIYVDGTSNPAYKHWEPALAEREKAHLMPGPL